MFPITLDLSHVRILLVGKGEPAARRLAQFQQAGATQVEFFSDNPPASALAHAHIVFITGLEEKTSAEIAQRARARGKLVNVEDRKDYCDFHIPSILRRGDLLFAISTGGHSPALAKLLRDWLGEQFPEQWERRLMEIADLRNQWRAQGLSMQEVSERSIAKIEAENWLPRQESELA